MLTSPRLGFKTLSTCYRIFSFSSQNSSKLDLLNHPLISLLTIFSSTFAMLFFIGCVQRCKKVLLRAICHPRIFIYDPAFAANGIFRFRKRSHNSFLCVVNVLWILINATQQLITALADNTQHWFPCRERFGGCCMHKCSMTIACS